MKQNSAGSSMAVNNACDSIFFQLSLWKLGFDRLEGENGRLSGCCLERSVLICGCSEK